ncbi:MAG: flagellar brake protein [Candidatus Sericytochromatia bacterium]
MAVLSEKFEFLALGLPIEVELQGMTDQNDLYFSQIMDVGNESMLISIPQRQGRIASHLYPGDHVLLRVLLQDAHYSCNCRMLSWQEQPQGLFVSLPSQVQRIQRRNFVRVDAELPIHLTLFDPNQPDQPDQIIGNIDSSTTDLSGGGLMAISEFEVAIDTLAEGKIYIPPENGDATQKWETIPFQAQVCRCLPHNGKFLIGVSFIEMNEGTRDRIIHYIFRYQRETIQHKPHLSI